MRRGLTKGVATLSLLLAILIVLGVAAGDCPEGALAQDSKSVETALGSFEIEVCVTHHLVARQHEYRITVTNQSVECKLQSFGVVPFPGIPVELEQSGMWQAGIDEANWWMWDGPSWQAIGSGSSREFSFFVPDTTPIAGVSGAVFTNPSSACGGNQLRYNVLGASRVEEEGQGEGTRDSAVFGELCTCEGEKEWFTPAQRINVSGGYRAEYVVAPSGLNVPSDVAISQDGEIFVTSSRAGAIYLVALDGSISRFASSHAYAIDFDDAGRLYGFNYPGGEVVRYDGSGRGHIVARLPRSACESTLAAAPDGTLYAALNYCMGDEMGDTTLYRLRAGDYRVETILDGIAEISSLDVGSDGGLYAVIDGVLSRIDPDGQEVFPLRELGLREISSHGLAVAEDGAIYVSSGSMSPEGAVYRHMPDGSALTEVAAFSGNGLQGIGILPDGSIIGVQRAIGGLQRILPDGTTSAIVEPNGLVSPQAICATSCGELVVVNDEAGWASIVCPDGTVNPFVRMTSFIAPLTYVASSEDGWIVAGESAPGFPSQLVRYSTAGEREVLTKDILDVSGVAVASDGSIYAAATREDRILVLSTAEEREVVTTDVRKPQALALSYDGRLYATVNRETDDDFEASMFGDAVVEILENGSARLVAEIDECYDLAVDEAGEIYVAAWEKIWRIDKYGSRSIFASGFEGARGVACLGGDLYITDDLANAIIRIVKIDSVQDEDGDDSSEAVKRGGIPVP